MKQNTTWTQLGIALLFSTLAACGGGGGGNGGGTSSRSQDNNSSAEQSSREGSSSVSSSESNSSDGSSSSEEGSSSSNEGGSASSEEQQASSSESRSSEGIGGNTSSESSSNESSSEASSSSSSKSATPPILVDLSAHSFTEGQSVSFTVENSGGGELTECTSDLPEGLSVAVSGDGTTCEVSGQAGDPIETTTFTVTATNAEGSDSAALPIEILVAAPSLGELTTQRFIQDERISISLTNTAGGELTECSSDLPTGLSVTVSEDGSTCEVNGEATELTELTNFTITAVNASGSDSVQVPLEIVEASPFVTTWKTDNEGVSDDNQILLQTSPEFSYAYRVDWGDGQLDEDVTGDITHTYDTPGEYTVSITGRFPQPFFSDTSDGPKLLTIESWGNRPWLSMHRALAYCDNLVINDTQAPNLTRVTDMSFMLLFNNNFNDDISHWDVSNVEDMNHLFRGAAAFNQDISGWDVSNVTNIDSVFQSAHAFNQDVGLWDVSNVTNMTEVFRDAIAFNQNIGTWDVSNATTMVSMFRETVVFNQNIGLWDVSGVTDMRAVFYDAQAFNQDIGGWDVSDVTTMNNMFRNASAFDQNLGGWNVSKVEAMADFAPNSGLTLQNYNALLNGWSAQGVREGVLLDVGVLQYGTEAEAARAVLTDVFGWSITDGGLLTPPDLQAQALTLYTNNPVDFVLGNLGGNPQTCTSNDLPAGVSVQVSQDSGSCRLIGTVSSAPAAAESTITASNAAGSNPTTVTFVTEEETPFITHWKTDNPGLSDDTQITIDTSPAFTYDYRVDWGDGQFDENVTGDITHTYAAPGEYEISITGTFPSIQLPDTSDTSIGDSLKLLSVEQWGDRSWLSMENAFINCDNLVINDPESPDLAAAKSLQKMFSRADNFNSDIGDWDVSSITDMAGMFSGANAFNQDIGDWDVSNVRRMNNMFNHAKAFNQDIGDWNVSNVTNMNRMFSEAEAFNQDIGRWDVANVITMNSMFFGTDLFNQDISGWDVSSVQNMGAMFRQTKAFNQELGAWNVSSVSNMSDMFFASPFNGDISQWNVSSVTNMSRMFRGSSFNQNIGGWDVSGVSNMSDLFGAGDLSTDNYDALLMGWSQLPELEEGVELGVGSTTFSPAAQAARDTLVNDFGWTISDGGSTEAAP